jgi:hypothetical protein
MLRFVFKRSQFDACSQARTERYETLDVECGAVQMLLQRGGQGEQGHDVTLLVGVEVLTGEVPEVAR